MLRHRLHPRHAPLEGPGARTLVDLAPGSGALVHQLRGGRLLAIRLSALGFAAGAPVTVLRNDPHGPLIVLVRGTRVALGRGAASKILVEVTGDATGPAPDG